MDKKAQLFAFEEKYPFLYDIQVNGVPIYTSVRDGVVGILEKGADGEKTAVVVPQSKGKIFIRRILDTFFKRGKYRKATTVIFTSSVYRRDNGRNLAAEYLLEKYPNGVVFEWPSRNEDFDRAYLTDKQPYVALDGYIVRYKLYCLLHKKKLRVIEEETREKIQSAFAENPPSDNVQKRIASYVEEALPKSVATTWASQQVFAKIFRKYKNIQYAIDFWGSGRENIIPVLQNKPQSLELQHGIITSGHQGYIYPEFVKNVKTDFFKRQLLVYGEATKKLLVGHSIFEEDKIEVVGNPRVQMYKKIFAEGQKQKKWILFSSQPYEQDYPGMVYYQKMMPYLQRLSELIADDGRYTLAIKLHPRENLDIQQLYEKELPKVKIFGTSSQLYELLGEAYLHITATSTVLLEALEFDVPTVTVQFNVNPKEIFGKETLHMDSVSCVREIWDKLLNEKIYNEYLEYLK